MNMRSSESSFLGGLISLLCNCTTVECEVHEVSVLNLQRSVVTPETGWYMQILIGCI